MTSAASAAAPDAGRALRRAVSHLLSLQREDGGWEGEMVWCPMLTAQYVLLHHVLERSLDPDRRRLVLRSFEHTRLEGGAWGLHEHSAPHLFVTTLVYVAARLLGVEPDDPLVARGRRFLQAEGVLGIPSWGKFWLALLNLYEWGGLNPVPPELWRLPRWLPVHPSKWYCHTRLIYMAMAVLYARRFQASVTPVISALREELFPEGYARVEFSKERGRLRDADLFRRPGLPLRFAYGFAGLVERVHGRRFRERTAEAIVERIRWEMRSSSHTCISPVSGILGILALWLRDPDDVDCRKALKKLEDWIWEDEEGGARVTGARSASWDTGFALQALASAAGFERASPDRDVDGPDGFVRRHLNGDGDGESELADGLGRGADFLARQQIRRSFPGFLDAYRIDPSGGWCFAGGWHGWPVSDCTAEAVLGLLAADGRTRDFPAGSAGIRREAAASGRFAALEEALRFMLRTQNRDGGFGSYEARRSMSRLEWLNPAEMFGDSMTEHSYVECTGSCLAALAACEARTPGVAERGAVPRAIRRAGRWLRRTQEGDGSWRGVWGVQFIYGTMFGVRGLLAAGAGPDDPALRAACRWLRDRQREDGGWGEHHGGCLTGRYVEHEQSQVIQTAWALIALLEAQAPENPAAIDRGARFLVDRQLPDGSWPKQDMAGVFFRTALLDYVLYRQYFPLHALGLYEHRGRVDACSGAVTAAL